MDKQKGSIKQKKEESMELIMDIVEDSPATTQAIIIEEKIPESTEPTYTFEVWFHMRKYKLHHGRPMKSYADANNMEVATLNDWDKLFSSY